MIIDLRPQFVVTQMVINKQRTREQQNRSPASRINKAAPLRARIVNSLSSCARWRQKAISTVNIQARNRAFTRRAVRIPSELPAELCLAQQALPRPDCNSGVLRLGCSFVWAVTRADIYGFFRRDHFFGTRIIKDQQARAAPSESSRQHGRRGEFKRE